MLATIGLACIPNRDAGHGEVAIGVEAQRVLQCSYVPPIGFKCLDGSRLRIRVQLGYLQKMSARVLVLLCCLRAVSEGDGVGISQGSGWFLCLVHYLLSD